MKILTREQECEILYECLFCRKFENLVQQYRLLIFHTIRKVFISRSIEYYDSDIHEVKNEILMRFCHNNCRKFWLYKEKGKVSLASWIIMITNRLSLNELRKKDIFNPLNRKKLIPIDEILPELENDETENSNELEDLISNAMEKLSVQQRIIIKLSFYYDLSPEEIAEILRKKRGAVDTDKSRAISKLRELLSIIFDKKRKYL